MTENNPETKKIEIRTKPQIDQEYTEKAAQLGDLVFRQKTAETRLKELLSRMTELEAEATEALKKQSEQKE